MLLLTQMTLVMVMGFRRQMAIRPVHRIKHVVDLSATLAKATDLPLNLIIAKDAPVLANTTEVETGATVNGFYLKVVMASNQVTEAGAIPNFYMIIFKNVGNNLTAPSPNAVGADDNKRFVLHQEMVMVQNQVSSNPTTVFNGVIKIPKGFKRFGPNDRLVLIVLSPAVDISVCAQCIYKEFR